MKRNKVIQPKYTFTNTKPSSRCLQKKGVIHKKKKLVEKFVEIY